MGSDRPIPEHEQHGGYLAMVEGRVGGGGDPLPVVFGTQGNHERRPDPSAVVN